MRFPFMLPLIAVVIPASASAQQVVLGKSLQASCYERALHDQHSATALNVCNRAVANANNTLRHRAATYINRGIVLMHRDQLGAALEDFDEAMELEPELGDIYTNRAALFIRMGRYDEAVLMADRALALNTERPQSALFNRAVAYENLGEVKKAYLDFKRAAELDPGWAAPRAELERFSVVSAS